MQENDFNGGLDDIAYNFLIGGDGAVYVGRGWDKIGEHTNNYNTGTIGIAFIGGFNEEEPPKCQLEAAQKLIDEGVQSRMLHNEYYLYGQRQLISTKSPGDALYKSIQKWKNYRQIIVWQPGDPKP